MNGTLIRIIFLLILFNAIYGQSPSFQTFTNPVIPGDHPDPTLTRIGSNFYTSGSSFNPTPKIYRSTDLVHWEVTAQPVSPSWSQYGDNPGGGIWGGHMVFYNGIYWHYFGKGGSSMYFVTADQPQGPWSAPVRVQVPAGMSGLGVDNSIFIDTDNGKWYLLTKSGQENNHIVELGENGQPSGVVLDLTWLNPNSEGNPYGWAEGPVMWKYNGYYFYSFAQHLVGSQYVMRSDTLTDDESAWTIVGTNIFTGPSSTFNRPNHISPVIMLDDSSSWVIVHSYHSSGSWYAQGRQGLLCQVTYNNQGFPVIQYPPSNAVPAPLLHSSGIPWMVPKSDMFNTAQLYPEWSFLGYTGDGTWSLTDRQGWLHLEPYNGSNTVIQNDGEHNYSLITRVDFEATSSAHEAGLWIINGPETHYAKVFSTLNDSGKSALTFSFANTFYTTENTIGNIVWLKLVRSEHMMSGFFSPDGFNWSQIGAAINALSLDTEQSQFNNFTGSQQGLYIKGKEAFFDLYIYRDAYTDIAAQSPANQWGVTSASSYLGNISNGDWALYAGVEFGTDTSETGEGVDYLKSPEQINVIAASSSAGGMIEVWLDSINTGLKIAEVAIENTGGWSSYNTFSSQTDVVYGPHDVYLLFKGADNEQLFRLRSFKFNNETTTAVEEGPNQAVITSFSLAQNYPNPFNPLTNIKFKISESADVSLKIYDILGKEVAVLIHEHLNAGDYSVSWEAKNADGSYLANGIYFYSLKAGYYVSTRKMIVLK